MSFRNSINVSFWAAVTVVLAVNGCKCEDPGSLNTERPIISVTPNPISFGDVAVNEEKVQIVTIESKGSINLELLEDPILVEDEGDGVTEFAIRAVYFAVDCADGSARDDSTPRDIAQGECVTFELVYWPQNEGGDTGNITIKSNDRDNGELVIPIDAVGAAPDIEVCVLAGECATEKTCADVGALSLDMTFPLMQIGDAKSCEVSISNTGALPLKELAWDFKSGNRRRDYTLDPTDFSTMGDLGAGDGITVKVNFSPKSGGPKEALLEITSTDPNEGAVTIRLNGSGDGPKICPEPFPAVDFGQVPVGQTVSQTVKLENCGTMSLDVTALEVQDSTGTAASAEFAFGAGAPTPTIALAPQATNDVPIEFTPPTIGGFSGRMYLETTDPVVPTGWVTLIGEGVVPPSCQLQTSTSVLSFGSAAPSSAGGVPVSKQLVLSNPGQLPCTNITAAITAGDAAKFTIVGYPAGGPPWTLAAGDLIVYTLEYDPADTTGPDTGTITFDSADVTAPIDVALSGSPVAAPTCDLTVTPKAGNFSFDQCASLGFNPRVAQFGAVKISQEKRLTISLENTGSSSCSVSSVTAQAAIPFSGADPNFTIETGGNRVMVNGNLTNAIKPGEIGEVHILYKPASEADNCGLVWMQTSDDNPTECTGFTGSQPDGCYAVYLKGQGVRSAIEVIPNEVEFGVVTVGCASKERDVTIYNIGGADMQVNKIYVDPTTSPFTITSKPPTPLTLKGGGQITIRVKYRPPDTNTHSALLVIESDATNGSFHTVPMSGQGTNDPHQQDQFEQLSEPMVDVLWVIDDSCSMGEEQTNIANNGSTFLDRALNLQTDFQVGVVTTDMDDPAKSGRLQSRNGRPKIITRTTSDPVGAFKDNIRQGTSGDATEKGLDAAHRALSDPLINDAAANLGFLRDDAKLVIIAVSDEEDSSTPTVDFYVDFFRNIKGYRNADLMSFSAVVGEEPSGCSSGNGDAVAGSRYLAVANRTGGLQRSICSADWGKIADDLGLDAFGAKSQFFLTRDAIDSTIEVRVNGQLVSRTGNYTYDAASNSVIFEPTSVPPQAATILVDYDTVCYP